MKKINKLISLLLTLILVLLVPFNAAALLDTTEKTLFKSEDKIRFSTELSGEAISDVEIISVTVTPHVRSGNIAYELTDKNSTNRYLGALVNIYVKNKSDRVLYPQVRFDGKTACEYLDTYPQQISWASTPDTRNNRAYDKLLSDEFEHFTPLTDYIPVGAVDCYSINITDGRLIYDGLEFEITVNGKTAKATLYADNPYVSLTRLIWSSSAGSRLTPDTLEFCIDNASLNKTTVNYIKLYDGTKQYYLHYWSEHSDDVKNISAVIPAGEMYFGSFSLSKPAEFCEYLVEINITNGYRTYSLIHKTKPFIHDFDISVGWAGDDLNKESFIKTISSMHFNTVIGAQDSDYYLRDDSFRKQYPIKAFGYVDSLIVGEKTVTENGTVKQYSIDDIHAALPFGEPQITDVDGAHQPMRVYNKLQFYRNSPYPTNVTLTHEPSFYRFAGLSDFCHYDAYRVVAPFSDPWYFYTDYAKENKYAVYWGAPLETQGDYMRSLVKMNQPNSVAAWTQGANTWDGIPRATTEKEYMNAPNPFELRIQAYENVANGANSLYWFNINGQDLLYYEESAKEMMRVNREFSTVSDYLAKQIPFWYERQGNFDLNVNIGSDFALLFACDLNYSIRNDQYKYNGCLGENTFSYKLPAFLSEYRTVVKVSDDGVSKCNAVFSDGFVTLTDSIDMTALYVLGDDNLISLLKNNYTEVIGKETYNIYENEEFYSELNMAYGYSEENPYVPEDEVRNYSLVLLTLPIVRALEVFVKIFAYFFDNPLSFIKNIITGGKK